MAKVAKNMFVRGLTGSLGEQFVIRKGRGGSTIISDKPTFGADRVFTDEQLAHQEDFQQAILYARSVKDEPVYVAKAEGTEMTAFNAAVADWFNKPVVLQIDARAWNGQSGQTIRVKAKDDTRVTQVTVRITAADETLLEQGEAAQVDNLWWAYTSTTVVADPASARIVATAEDRPGNRAELVLQN